MERPSFHDLSTSTYEFKDLSMFSSNHELDPDLINMVQDRPFSGAINEDSYIHLKEFKDTLGYPRHDTENREVQVVSFLYYRESGAMVHSHVGGVTGPVRPLVGLRKSEMRLHRKSRPPSLGLGGVA
jgi:hypothetical protein